jgi:SET domain-containing protein
MASKKTKIEARRSGVHGTGVFALARIRKGETIIEVVGERISPEEADRRAEAKGTHDGHTFFFHVDDETVIDCGVNGNVSRFINHSCDPNCEAVDYDGRIYLEAIRTIQPGEELFFDYQLTWDGNDDPEDLEVYRCRCGAASCRGTMLNPEPLAEAS